MTVIETSVPGTFCWADLGTPDAAAAKRFYTGLFGWSVEDRPMGADATYTMFTRRRQRGRRAVPAGAAASGIPAALALLHLRRERRRDSMPGPRPRRHRPHGRLRRARRGSNGIDPGSDRRRRRALGAEATHRCRHRRRAEHALLERARDHGHRGRRPILRRSARLEKRAPTTGRRSVHHVHARVRAGRRNDGHRPRLGTGATALAGVLRGCGLRCERGARSDARCQREGAAIRHSGCRPLRGARGPSGRGVRDHSPCGRVARSSVRLSGWTPSKPSSGGPRSAASCLDPVPRETIRALLDCAVRAPNHKLTEPWRFAVLSGGAVPRFAELRARHRLKRYTDPESAEARAAADKMRKETIETPASSS